jgi:hypothetical protein
MMIVATVYAIFLFIFLLCSNSRFISAENLNFLESKISAYQLELRSRARIIYELKNRLQDEKLNSSFQPHLEEISIN